SLHVPPPTAPSTLSLHDALPIFSTSQHAASPSLLLPAGTRRRGVEIADQCDNVPILFLTSPPQGLLSALSRLTERGGSRSSRSADRKSTRLNSSHVEISYAVFCL